MFIKNSVCNSKMHKIRNKRVLKDVDEKKNCTSKKNIRRKETRRSTTKLCD